MMRDDATASDSIRPESLLRSRTNPRNSLDFIVTHSGALGPSGLHVSLRYVPDKLLVDDQSLAAFFASLARPEPIAPETVALAILDELNNEIVPRWVQIAVTGGNDAGGQPSQTVSVEDRQPNWENLGILGRLPPL